MDEYRILEEAATLSDIGISRSTTERFTLNDGSGNNTATVAEFENEY